MSPLAEAIDGDRKGFRTLADEARRVWVSLFFFLFTSLAAAPGPYPWILAALPAVGAGLRAVGWQKIRGARVSQPALSDLDLRGLRAVFSQQNAVFNLFGLTVTFLALVDLPRGAAAYSWEMAAVLWWVCCLSLDLLELHRDSETGGWVFSFGRWLQKHGRRSEGGLWALIVVKGIFSLPYIHSRLLGGEAERSVVLSLWLLLAFYLGVRTPALPLPDGVPVAPPNGGMALLSPGDARRAAVH